MRIHVRRAGHGNPPIVFVHGLGMSGSTWARCVELLSPNHETVAIDLIGHGLSPVPDDPADYNRDAALRDLDDVLATLTAAPVLVGHSLGGYLALAYAATRPDALKGVVVLNTGPGYRDAEKREEWNARTRRNRDRFGVPPQVTELNLQHDSVVMDRLAEMTVPTLVLAGSADRPEYTGAGQYLERKMPNCRLTVIDGGGHSMHEESHATDVASAISAFIASI
jgi:pimeloyl-ACP methyl ester carboxylesterase